MLYDKKCFLLKLCRRRELKKPKTNNNTKAEKPVKEKIDAK